MLKRNLFVAVPSSDQSAPHSPSTKLGSACHFKLATCCARRVFIVATCSTAVKSNRGCVGFVDNKAGPRISRSESARRRCYFDYSEMPVP